MSVAAPPRPAAPSKPPTTVEVRQRPEPRGALVDPAGTLAVTLLTIVTAIGLCRLFPDWTYLRQLLTVVVGVHAAAAVMRFVRVRGWIAVPAVLVVLLVLLSIVYYRDTTRFLLPTGDTIEFIRADLRLVWQQFPSAVAPVPSEGSFAMAAAALLGACALLADTFAFRAFGRAEAVVPAGVVFVFTSALGTDRNRIAVSALWIGTAIVVIAVLRFSHAREDAAWMGAGRRTIGSVLPATLACATIAALAAAVLAPRLPGATSGALFDTHSQGSDATQVLNPLVDIRSRLINRANVEVFTVQASAPAYWREIALESFDGTQWTPTDGQPLRTADGELANIGSGTPIDQTITISRLGGKLVPAAFAPVSASSPGLLYADDTQTVVVSDPLSSGQVIELTSVRSDPPADQLRLATVSQAPRDELYDLPSDFPDEARELAADVTAGATNPYDQMVALQNWFRADFTYDLSVQAGNSDEALRQFLRIRRGYCEQFSAAFASMARSLGVPARVAIGFTPGELRDDGLYHVYDRHAHAWPEVWFDGFGWISFEPTPGRGEPGAENHTGVGAAQDATAATAAGAGGGADQPVATTASTVVARPVNPEAGTTDTTTTTLAPALTASGDGGSSTPFLIAFAIIGLAVAWLMWMPRVARSWGRHRRAQTAAERVSAAWNRACGVLRVAGASGTAGTTPIEYSKLVEREIGVDQRVVGELARTVTRAVYAPDGVDDSSAVRSEQLEQQIDEICQRMIPTSTRVLARIDPRVARATG